jgi:hypothetical protein
MLITASGLSREISLDAGGVSGVAACQAAGKHLMLRLLK